MLLFVAFLLVPVIEIALFIKVGGWIGFWPTLLIVIVMAVAGARLMRSQGLAVLGQLRGSLQDLRDPTAPLAHGALILFAGVLMLTPGFFTDVIGLLLMIPWVRQALIAYLSTRVRFGRFEMGGQGAPEEGVIDGEFTEVNAPRPPLR